VRLSSEQNHEVAKKEAEKLVPHVVAKLQAEKNEINPRAFVAHTVLEAAIEMWLAVERGDGTVQAQLQTVMKWIESDTGEIEASAAHNHLVAHELHSAYLEVTGDKQGAYSAVYREMELARQGRNGRPVGGLKALLALQMSEEGKSYSQILQIKDMCDRKFHYGKNAQPHDAHCKDQLRQKIRAARNVYDLCAEYLKRK